MEIPKGYRSRKDFFDENQATLFDNYDPDEESNWTFKKEFRQIHKDNADDPIMTVKGNKGFGYNFPENNLTQYRINAKETNNARRIEDQVDGDNWLSPSQQRLILTPNSKILSSVKEQSIEKEDNGFKYLVGKELDSQKNRAKLNVDGGKYDAQQVLGIANDREGAYSFPKVGGKGWKAVTGRHLTQNKNSTDPRFYVLGKETDNAEDEKYIDLDVKSKLQGEAGFNVEQVAPSSSPIGSLNEFKGVRKFSPTTISSMIYERWFGDNKNKYLSIRDTSTYLQQWGLFQNTQNRSFAHIDSVSPSWGVYGDNYKKYWDTASKMKPEDVDFSSDPKYMRLNSDLSGYTSSHSGLHYPKQEVISNATGNKVWRQRIMADFNNTPIDNAESIEVDKGEIAADVTVLSKRKTARQRGILPPTNKF